MNRVRGSIGFKTAVAMLLVAVGMLGVMVGVGFVWGLLFA